jgi:hypothetical protein
MEDKDKDSCQHEWWYRHAGTMEVGEGKIDMYESRCTRCGAGRAMDTRVAIRELKLVGYVGQLARSVLSTAIDALKPLFDSPTKEAGDAPERPREGSPPSTP